MRKIITLAIFVVGFAACGDSSDPPEGTDTGPGGDTDVMDAGDLDSGEEIGVDADVGEDAEPDMGPPDGGDTDSGETGPDGGPDADSGPSCNAALDTDADGLNNCDEMELCTSPTNSDSDDDKLSDFEELEEGTDPCKADTDNDGVSDYREIQLGLNPNKPSTFGDDTIDEERWRVDACEKSESLGPDDEIINYYTNNRGNWRIGLRKSFSNYRNMTLRQSVVSGPTAAAVYGNPLSTVHGFVLSQNADPSEPSPYEAMANRVRPAVLSLAAEQGGTDYTGSNFENHGGQQASIGRYAIKVSPKMSAKKLREELLFEFADFDEGAVSDPLPNTAGQDKAWFRVEISIIYRENVGGAEQALYSVAVTPRDIYDNREQVRFQLSDLVNTTNIAEIPDKPQDGCATFKPDSDIPKAEFYWVLDQSGSMGPFNSTVSAFAQQFVNQLQGVQLDYRLGVTNMVDENDGMLRSPGWTKNPAQFSNAVDTGVTDCQEQGSYKCSNGDEYGLENGKLGLTRLLGLQGMPPPTRRIRSGANVITIFMTDDSSNAIRDGSASASDYTNFYPKHTQAFSIVDKDDCGASAAPVYEEVSKLSSGNSASLCVGADNLTGILTSIINAANARASDYQLSRTPISASLQVFVNGEYVPRSREDGFDYFAQFNSIGFYGSYGPEPSETGSGIAEDFVVVEYDYFENSCKESDQGADNCRGEDF